MSQVDADLINELAAIRVRSGLTIRDVAARMIVTPGAVCQIEGAHRRRGGTITLARLLAYARAIGAEIHASTTDTA